MVINEIKKDLIYSKNVTITSKYIILYKGASLAIYDYNFVLQKNIHNLRYVYNGYVSPDEKKLLLVSNTNRYYIFSLEDFSLIVSSSIKKPYNGGIEGVACWVNNDSFMLPVQNPTSMLSTLRKIGCVSPFSFDDFLLNEFWVRYITFIEHNNKCLILGLNRQDHVWNIIWMDQHGKCTIHKILDFDEAIFNVFVSHNTETLVLTGESKQYSCDFYGNPTNIWGDYLAELNITHDFMTCFQVSQKNASIAYLGTTGSLIVYDLKERRAIRLYRMEFGARAINEFGNFLFVSSHNGIHLISLCE